LALAFFIGLVTTSWQWRRAEHQRTLTAAANLRLRLQRAEDFLDSERAHLALPILARMLRDFPANRLAQERLVNLLNLRAVLAPFGAPGNESSAGVQLALRVARSGDGGRVVTATNADPTMIQLWDGHSGALLHTFDGAHSNVIRNLTFSPDGK
jgi:hypothetical protein